MKNPSVPSRCGSVCRKPGTPPWSHSGTSSRRSSAREVPAPGEEPAHDVLVLGGRDRAGAVDQRAAGADGVRAGREDRRLRLREPAPGWRRPCASGRRGGRRACRGPSTAGRRARGRTPPSCGCGGVRGPDGDARRRPSARAVRRSASARPGWRSTATTAPVSSISAARWVVLPPGAAQRSSTRSPGRGPTMRATAIAARDCGMKRPACQSGESKASNGASSTRPSGRPGRGMRGDRELGREGGRVAAQRVGAQRGLGGLVVGGHERARGVGPERVEPERGDPLGMGVAQGGLGRRAPRGAPRPPPRPRARRAAGRR